MGLLISIDAMNSTNSSLEFVCCGSLLLNRDAVGVRRLHMEDFIYPLEGTIELKSRCTALPPLIETAFRGFLVCCFVVQFDVSQNIVFTNV